MKSIIDINSYTALQESGTDQQSRNSKSRMQFAYGIDTTTKTECITSAHTVPNSSKRFLSWEYQQSS